MKSPRSALILAGCVLLGFSAYLLFPLLTCLDQCFVDLLALHGRRLGLFESPDIRLNAWILAWVQHGLVTQPLELFNANMLYPSPNILAGSEHLIGLALLTLPLRLFTSNAILIYQLTLVLSSVILALTTLALVRWLTGSLWISVLSGVMTLVMPWRVTELAHIQLMGAHWFPLIWLLALRILVGQGRWRTAALLSLVLGLQLLTSYYLAYILTLSLAILLGMVALQVAPGRGVVHRLSLATIIPYGLLFLTSIPYLDRQVRGELFTRLDLETPRGIDAIVRSWDFVAPRFETVFNPSPFLGHSYTIPLVVAVLGILALVLSFSHDRHADAPRLPRAVTVSLWVCMLAGFVMMLGPQIRVGALTLKLPSYWASQFVPGFSNLRAPHRWGIIIGIAFPVLAGLGIVFMDGRLTKLPSARGRVWLRGMARVSIVLLLLVNLPWRQLPARQVWDDSARVTATYEALRALPHGPVVEIPWHIRASSYVHLDTRYMLASTLHWRPILNGFTAHLPPTFKFLRRAARRLPERDAITVFSRLTDVRWIVVHLDKLTGPDRLAWRDAATRGDLRRTYAGDHTRIFEIPRHDETGIWMSKLASTEVRAETLTGLPRTALALPVDPGRLDAKVRDRLRYRGTAGYAHPVALTVTNASDVDWPGFDYQTEGLVALRYVFLDDDGEVVRKATASLDVDIAAQGTTRAYPLITPPTRHGRYRLRLDLVQRLGDTLQPLPLPPVGLDVTVARMGKRSKGPS